MECYGFRVVIIVGVKKKARYLTGSAGMIAAHFTVTPMATQYDYAL